MNMKYDISIRVTFPEEITNILRKEKQRFVAEYGSGYKSEPHITLYLDSYTIEGYPTLLAKLRELRVKPFIISLLEPKINVSHDSRCNHYVVDVSNKSQFRELHNQISAIAIPYRSPFIRGKIRKRLELQGIHTNGTRANFEALNIPEEAFDPHITLGEIDFDKPQADIEICRKNLASIEDKNILVSSITVFFYGKEDEEEKARLLEKVTIPFGEG